jgi:hypothetical protein
VWDRHDLDAWFAELPIEDATTPLNPFAPPRAAIWLCWNPATKGSTPSLCQNFWERTEMSGLLRDVREKPGKYDWLDRPAAHEAALPAPDTGNDDDLGALLENLRSEQ